MSFRIDGEDVNSDVQSLRDLIDRGKGHGDQLVVSVKNLSRMNIANVVGSDPAYF